MVRTTAGRRTIRRTRTRTGAGLRTGAAWPGRTTALVLALGGLLIIAGCATGTGTTDQDASGATPSSSDDATSEESTTADPTDGAWTLVSGEVDGEDLTLVDPVPVTLLVENGRVGGNAACNTYLADVDTSDGWRVGDAAVTRMACEEELMTLETAYLAALARVEAAEVTDDTLELTGPDVRLVFAADPTADPTAD